MKILLWPTMYFPNIGGLEKMTHTLAKELQRKGHDLLVISNSQREESFTIDHIPVYTFPLVSTLFRYELPSIAKILHSISQVLDRFSPDMIHIHGWFECFSFYQVRILQKRTTPLCLTIHGMLEQDHYQTEHCMKLYNRAQAVSVVSNALLPPPHPNLKTIYNGLPLSSTPLTPIPLQKLLLVGRLSEEKCFSVAFYALKLLLPKYPSLRLTLLGHGPCFDELFALKESLQLPIDMPGFVPPNEVESFIDHATIVIVPSSYESFSLVALEAALRGRPVVASRILGLKEVIEDGKTGLLVEPNSPDSLTSAIDTLLSNERLLNEMGKAAFERASRLFTIDLAATHYLELYAKAARLCHHPSS